MTNFFAQISRFFVCELSTGMSRTAWRVLAYLRTWCFGKPGQASEWRELSVKKIAAELKFCVRNVQYGLAELVERGIIERREQFDELPSGVRAQRANLWRVLPEPGFPVPEQPKKRERQDESPPDALAEILATESSNVLAALPGWVDDERISSEQEASAFSAVLEEIATTGEPYEGAKAEIERALDESSSKASQARDLLSAASAVVAALAVDRWRELALATIAHRAARALVARGMRARRASALLTRERIEAALTAEALQRA